VVNHLQDITVVELVGSVAGSYCAKMFADGGATVLLVGESGLSAHQQACFDERKIPAAFEDIDFETIDVVIQSTAPDPLSPLQIAGEQIVHVHISPMGARGARSAWKSTDLTDYAMSGHAHLYGHPDREPLKGPPDQPAVAAGLYGFVGAMAGLVSRSRLGGGQVVDISHLQVMVALHQVTLLRWLMAGDVLTRMGNRYTGQGQPNGPYQCEDGWVSIVGVTEQQVESLLAVTDLLHLLDHPDITSVMDFLSHPELLDEPLNEWLRTQKVQDVVALFQAVRIPACPLLDPIELLDDPQLVAREFFRPLESDPSTMVPGSPFAFGHEQSSAGKTWQPGDLEAGPLSGLRVLDLARVWAGPLCARILCDLGAEVVWVEAPWHRGPKQVPQSFVSAIHQFPNDEAGERQWNRNSHFVKYSLGKQSLAIDLQTERGQAVLAQLVPDFHVLLENFSTRVMPQLGFNEERLHQLNPDLVYLTMPGYGRSGPAEQWLAYGSCVDSHAGLSSLIGYADESPWKGGIAWPDPIAGLHAASAVMGALWQQLRQGAGGVTIEAAQFESTIAAIGDRVVEAQRDGTRVATGNREAAVLAQGIYRCAGNDEWIAISIPDEPTLLRLAHIASFDPAIAADHDALDSAVTSFTGTGDAHEVAQQLQTEGIPAAKVAKAPDLLADPHLRSINNWVTIEQPDIGEFVAGVTPISLSATPVRPPRPAPTMGEHNRAVLERAGIDRAEIAALAADSVIAIEPPS